MESPADGPHDLDDAVVMGEISSDFERAPCADSTNRAPDALPDSQHQQNHIPTEKGHAKPFSHLSKVEYNTRREGVKETSTEVSPALQNGVLP